MKRMKILLGIISSIVLCMVSVGINKAETQAAQKWELNPQKKVSGVKFTLKEYQSGDYYYYSLIMNRNGKTEVIEENTNASFVTNGKVVYYVKKDKAISEWEYKNSIYKYDIRSGKKSRIVSGTEYTIKACNGKYLYYGRDYYADGVNLYAMNLKTKQKKHMVDGVGSVITYGKKVVTSTNSGDVGNYPIHSFKADGTGKKKVVNGMLVNVKNKKIYYARVNYKTWKYRVYTCSLTGGHKKAITGWKKEIPQKYYK